MKTNRNNMENRELNLGNKVVQIDRNEVDKKEKIDLKSPVYYFNRELSLIEFNKRVLAEAADYRHPLLERLKFLAILSSNLDEFYMIRVAGLKRLIAAGVEELSFDGLTPIQQLEEIQRQLIPLYEQQEKILTEVIIPDLNKELIFIHYFDDITPEEKKYLYKYFCESILPLLTPMSLDPAHPFPRIINRSLNIAFALKDKSKKISESKVAFLQIPITLPRFVKLERSIGYHFVLIEQIIKTYSGILFPGFEIETTNTFRVTRDADIEIAEDEAEDLLTEIAEQIKHRKWGTAPVRLDVSANMPDYLVNLLMKSLELEKCDVFIRNRPLNFPDFMQLTKLNIAHLKDIPFQTRQLSEFQIEGISVFDAVKKKDLLVHHPYDSFSNNVLKFINEGADDPDVVAIKTTLYRVGINSPVVEALKRAAENGKDVTAFVELKARFDEENNIFWAKDLEQVGAHVVYGVLGLKTHCKIAMIVRRENQKLVTYLHLSTGNYNHITTRLYTDIGFFTSNEDFAMDAIHLFNYLTGYSNYKDWNSLIVAPINLRQRVIELINREADLHTPENPGLIFAKMNSLAHSEVTQALYRASQKGVQIKLLVRGLCCLKPGLPDVSENIEVRSILGRFLEHSRIFYFKNAGNKEVYLASADWMTRNLHRRVELMFPIKEKNLQKKLIEILRIYWKDNTKAWKLMSDGSYQKVIPEESEELLCAQDYFLEEAKKARKKSRVSVSK